MSRKIVKKTSFIVKSAKEDSNKEFSHPSRQLIKTAIATQSAYLPMVMFLRKEIHEIERLLIREMVTQKELRGYGGHG